MRSVSFKGRRVAADDESHWQVRLSAVKRPGRGRYGKATGEKESEEEQRLVATLTVCQGSGILPCFQEKLHNRFLRRRCRELWGSYLKLHNRNLVRRLL